jgi:hypothetical protein
VVKRQIRHPDAWRLFTCLGQRPKPSCWHCWVQNDEAKRPSHCEHRSLLSDVPAGNSDRATSMAGARRHTHAVSTAPAIQTLTHTHVDIEVGLLGVCQNSTMQMWPMLLRLHLFRRSAIGTSLPCPTTLAASAAEHQWSSGRR